MKYNNSVHLSLTNLHIVNFDGKKWVDIQGHDGSSIVPFRIKTTTLKMCYRDAFSFFAGIPSVKIQEPSGKRNVRLFVNMVDFLNSQPPLIYTMVVNAGKLVCIGFGTRKNDLLQFYETKGLPYPIEYNDCSIYLPYTRGENFSIGIGKLNTCRQADVIVVNSNTEIDGTCVRFIPYQRFTFDTLLISVDTFVKSHKWSLHRICDELVIELSKSQAKTFYHLDEIIKRVREYKTNKTKNS